MWYVGEKIKRSVCVWIDKDTNMFWHLQAGMWAFGLSVWDQWVRVTVGNINRGGYSSVTIGKLCITAIWGEIPRTSSSPLFYDTMVHCKVSLQTSPNPNMYSNFLPCFQIYKLVSNCFHHCQGIFVFTCVRSCLFGLLAGLHKNYLTYFHKT